MAHETQRITGAPQPTGKAPPGAVYRIRPGYTLREVAGEHLAIPVSDEAGASGRLAILNTTGKFLFRLLQRGMTREMLLTEMLEAFDVSPEEARADIGTFLAQLAQNGLLHINSLEDTK